MMREDVFKNDVQKNYFRNVRRNLRENTTQTGKTEKNI